MARECPLNTARQCGAFEISPKLYPGAGNLFGPVGGMGRSDSQRPAGLV